MFTIAETIKCGTVDEISDRMSVSELSEWQEYFKLKEKERKRKQREAKAKRKR